MNNNGYTLTSFIIIIHRHTNTLYVKCGYIYYLCLCGFVWLYIYIIFYVYIFIYGQLYTKLQINLQKTSLFEDTDPSKKDHRRNHEADWQQQLWRVCHQCREA